MVEADLQVLVEHEELAARIVHCVLAEVVDHPPNGDGQVRLRLGWE